MDEDRDTASRLLTRACLALCLVYLLLVMWHLLLPERRRLALRLRLIRLSAQVTSVTARRAGAASLRREAECGVEDYELPLRLSLLRERLEAAYDRARGVTA